MLLTDGEIRLVGEMANEMTDDVPLYEIENLLMLASGLKIENQ